MYKGYNDYELISYVKENDEFSESIIFKKYDPIIRRLSNDYYMNYSKYGLDREDFYQEALLAFSRALVSYNDQINCKFYTFVIICIKRKLISLCRNISNSNKNLSNDYLDDIDSYEISDIKSNTNSLIDFLEFENIIKNSMYDFSFENICIFELKYNNFTYEEISLLLDMPLRNIEYRYRKLKRIINRILFKNGFN